MNYSQYSSGMLSDSDIKKLISQKEIVITNYDEKNLTPLGYNLTPTEFILSIKNQLLVKIHNEELEKYCYIEPNDTVLIMTREAIAVSKNIAGTFHAKVGMVSLGFGHISTTLDPLWRGPLLISLNNPTNKRLKFTLAKIKKVEGEKSEDIDYTYLHKSFITLIFHKLTSPTLVAHDNKPGRFDQLTHVVQKQVKPKGWRKLLFWKRQNQHFANLKDLIDTIGSIQYTQSNININEDLNVEEFYKSHDNFSELLKFYTDRAHATTSKIIYNKKYGLNILYTMLGIIGLILIGLLIYFAWTMGVKKDKPAVVAFFALLIPLVATIIYPYFSKLIKLIIGRKEEI
ncbi:dCTP deaminase domain-containing protein [Peribacillus asahii]|uniref:dCTP deaminase domain-containing protein n=1 Tax=Peribacillus asahii TaxID=228899 RepID=UPI0020797535|nr:hypothetical protein [Peribacillus asahii]USK68411.1 hypothetical protein LIS76_12345 [Peribacillus asahii]